MIVWSLQIKRNAGLHFNLNYCRGQSHWSYKGTEDSFFYSSTSGYNQRLANGNTLITESNNGRGFEVNHEGEVVWEYISPYRVGEEGNLVATLFQMFRIDGAAYPFVGELLLGQN